MIPDCLSGQTSRQTPGSCETASFPGDFTRSGRQPWAAVLRRGNVAADTVEIGHRAARDWRLSSPADPEGTPASTTAGGNSSIMPAPGD
jgi:hypothetical protein